MAPVQCESKLRARSKANLWWKKQNTTQKMKDLLSVSNVGENAPQSMSQSMETAVCCEFWLEMFQTSLVFIFFALDSFW